MCGGPTCTFQGKEVPCHVNVSPNASITSMMLAEMLSDIDCAGMFDRQPDGPKPFLLLDGHHSQFELPFLSYINDSNEYPWVVCIGMPYGTHIWQVADLSELNGAFKMELTHAKNSIYAAKPNDMKKWLVSNFILIINQAFQTSLGMVDKALKAIIDRGWRTLNYALLEHCKVLKTKPVPRSNDSSSEVPSDQVLELAASVLTNSDAETITINVSKGAAGKAIDTIVWSEVKSDGKIKACRERMEREEDVAAVGQRLTKMGRVTSGAMVSQGNYCLGADIHLMVVEDVIGKQAAAAAAGVNCGVKELARGAKALAAWTKCLGCTRGNMPIAKLKVLIQDIKRGKLDSPLRKVRVQGEPERPVIEGQCKEREVQLVKEEEGKVDHLTHYDLHMLLEVEGVGPEKDLLTRTEDDLRAELHQSCNNLETNDIEECMEVLAEEEENGVEAEVLWDEEENNEVEASV